MKEYRNSLSLSLRAQILSRVPVEGLVGKPRLSHFENTVHKNRMQRNRLPRRFFFFFFFNTNTGLLPYASSPALAFAIPVHCSNNVASSYPVVIE